MPQIRYRIEYAADNRRPEFYSLKAAIAFLRKQGYRVPRRKRHVLTVAYVTRAAAREAAKGGNVKASAYIVRYDDPAWTAERDRRDRIDARLVATHHAAQTSGSDGDHG